MNVTAPSQDPLSSKVARLLVEYVIELAESTLGPPETLKSDPIAATILGLNGKVLASAAMDGVRPVAVELSRRKAVSALETWFDTAGIAGYLSLLGATFSASDFDPEFTSFGGGRPLRLANGAIVASIGVSGRMTAKPADAAADHPPQDSELADMVQAKLLELEAA